MRAILPTAQTSRASRSSELDDVFTSQLGHDHAAILASLGNAPFGNRRCGTKAIDRTLAEPAIEGMQFSLNDFADLGRFSDCAEIEQ
jgi:hypothetical protein